MSSTNQPQSPPEECSGPPTKKVFKIEDAIDRMMNVLDDVSKTMHDVSKTMHDVSKTMHNVELQLRRNNILTQICALKVEKAAAANGKNDTGPHGSAQVARLLEAEIQKLQQELDGLQPLP